MKKFLLFLTLLVSAIGLAHAQAEEPSYTITFKESGNKGDGAEITAKTNLTDIISVGTDYVSNISGLTKVYIAKGTYGIKIGQASASGNITFNLSDAGNVTATKIVISAAAYNSSSDKQGTLFVYLNDNATENFKQKLTTTSLSDIIIPLTPATKLSSIKLGANKYIHVKSITVYYKDGTSGEGTTLIDPEISWTDLVEGAVKATLGGENTLPTLYNPHGVGITYSSSDESVATIAADGTIEIKAAGTTTIKAVSTADETYKSATATFTLNVNDPSLLKFTLNVNDDITGLSDGDIIHTITFNDITLSSAGAKYYTSEIRVYAGNSIDVSVPSQYYIQKIEFTGSTLGNMSVTSTNGTLVTNTYPATWTYDSKKDKSNKVSFKNNASSQFRITSITITCGLAFADDDAGLAFANATDNATYGTEYTLQTLTNPKNVEVTWSSSDTNVAEFATDGSLTFKKAGETIITATATDAKYTTNNTASYTLTIAKGDPGLAFAEATINKLVGDAAFTNLLTNPKGLTVTYATDPAESTVAKVNATTGEVTILAAGEVTIVASSAETETYKAGSASYTLKVVDTKLYDTFNASNLTFDGESGYRNFTYTAESGAVYGGFADANESTLMIQNQANGKSGIFVSQAPKGYKLHTITVSTANGSAELTLYGSTKPYASVSTDGKSIATIESGKKNEIFVNGYTATLGAYGIIPTTFSVCGADKASSVTEITVIWEVDTRAEAELAYSPAEVTLAEGETLTQPKLNNLNNLTVTYASDNEAVATVTTEGVIALAGEIGTAVITASTEGNATHKAGSATFTISVREPIDQVANFSLVTNINDLQAGDIIVIACPEKTKVMSTEVNTTIRPSVIATFSDDKSTLTTPADGLQLQVEKSEDGYWLFRTTNYLGTNGYLSSNGTNKNCIISETITDKTKASIALSETGVVTILFNKGTETSSSDLTWLTYNNTNNALNEGRFACYNTLQSSKDIFIYKFESNQQTIVGEDLTEVTMNEGQGPNTLSAMSLFSTNSTVNNFVVKMNGVTITSADVVREEDTEGNNNITVNLSGLPYIPGAEFTIAPVVNGKEGHSEVLGIHMPALPTFTVTDSSRELMFNDEEATAGTCNIDAVIKLYVTSTAGEGAYGFNYYFDFENLSGFENHHWDWLNDSKGNGVTYVVEDYLTNVTTKAQGEAENVVYVPVLPTEESLYSELAFNLKPYFVFNVTPELASLITEATPAPMAAPARAGEAFVIQNVYSTALEQRFTFNSTTDVSGVEGVTVDGGAAVEYFNLQGVRVDGDLAPGIYIRRQGQSVSKVQIR